LQRSNRLASGEAGAQFVPVPDGFLAQFPAQAHRAALVPAEKIDQSDLVILQIAANVMQLVDIGLQLLQSAIQIGLDGGLVLQFGGFHGGLKGNDLSIEVAPMIKGQIERLKNPKAKGRPYGQVEEEEGGADAEEPTAKPTEDQRLSHLEQLIQEMNERLKSMESRLPPPPPNK